MSQKNLLTVAFTLFALNLPMAAAYAHAEHGQPQFGGVVAEAGLAQFEVVAKDGKVVVYVTNHGAALDTAGAKGKLTVLAGTAKSEIALAPAGGNRLEGSGKVAGGDKLLINTELAGQKPLQARAVAR